MPTENITPQHTQKLYGLDHLRALAIILVFFFHYQLGYFGHPAWLPSLIKFGWTGVDLFFVLSGFLISSQLFTQIRETGSSSLRAFFVKRVFRILPAYSAVLAIYFCIPAFHERESLPPLWKFATFTQNLGLDIKDYGTFSHAWSLCVEEHFYLLLPLVLLVLLPTRLFKNGFWLLPALFVAGIFIRHYCWVHIVQPATDTADFGLLWYRHIYYPTYCRLDGLLAGVSIAAVYHYLPHVWTAISKAGNLLLLAGIGILVAASFVCGDSTSYIASVWGFPLVAIGYAALVMAAISPSCFLYRWPSKITSFIATLSFAIYLAHKGIIHVTQQLLANTSIDSSSTLMMIICIIATMIGALIINLAIEKPFLKLRRKLLS